MKVLFVCNGNSCRSLMAEAWAKHIYRGMAEIYSAGFHPQTRNPHAVTVMAESGIDLSGFHPKHIDEVPDDLDMVVILCSRAYEHCPSRPGKNVITMGFDSPSANANEVRARGGTAEQQMDCYRQSRDEIKVFVEALPIGHSLLV